MLAVLLLRNRRVNMVFHYVDRGFGFGLLSTASGVVFDVSVDGTVLTAVKVKGWKVVSGCRSRSDVMH